MTSKQREYREDFEKDFMTTEIMLTGNDDYNEAQDKAEREIMGKIELEGFQVMEF